MKTTYRTTHSYKPHSRAERALTLAVLTALLSDAAAAPAMAAAKNVTIAEDETVNASGTNHTLPTSGYAKAYSGVNIDSFTKKITFQHLTPEGLASIGPAIEILAENEDLMAHRLAVTVRLDSLKGKS